MKTKYGTIKATYAQLYDIDGNLLFSLQHKDMGNSAAVICSSNDMQNGYLRVQLTKKALEVIQRLTDGKYKGGENVFVNPVAFDWEEKTNLLPFIGVALLTAFIFSK